MLIPEFGRRPAEVALARRDAELIALADDVVDNNEDLVSGLSPKIWQKLMVLDRVQAGAAAGGAHLPEAPLRSPPLTGNGRLLSRRRDVTPGSPSLNSE